MRRILLLMMWIGFSRVFAQEPTTQPSTTPSSQSAALVSPMSQPLSAPTLQLPAKRGRSPLLAVGLSLSGVALESFVLVRGMKAFDDADEIDGRTRALVALSSFAPMTGALYARNRGAITIGVIDGSLRALLGLALVRLATEIRVENQDPDLGGAVGVLGGSVLAGVCIFVSGGLALADVLFTPVNMRK